jgi:hypothetical protein
MTIEEDIEAFATSLPASYDTEVELDALHALVAAHPDYPIWIESQVRGVLAERLIKYRTIERHMARISRQQRRRAQSLANINTAAGGGVVVPTASLYQERYCVGSGRGRGRHMALGDMTAEDCLAGIDVYTPQRDSAAFKVNVLSFFARTLVGANTVAQQFTEQQIENVYASNGRTATGRRRQVRRSA